MAEMWTRAPIMQGSTEQQQIQYITQLCGSITPEVWPGVENLDLYNKLELPKGQKRKVSFGFGLLPFHTPSLTLRLTYNFVTVVLMLTFENAGPRPSKVLCQRSLCL